MDNASVLQTYIFIGRSGCGKGTQAKLLIEKLQSAGVISEQNPFFHIETGAGFRELVSGTGYTSRLSKEVMDRSDRQPDFLAVWIWGDFLVKNLKGNEHLIFDGCPRSLYEATMLIEALQFYGRSDINVIYMDVSNDWSIARLKARGRFDDQKAGDIEKRLAWFEKDVLPAIDFFAKNEHCHFYQVNGEQTVELVHQEIMNKLKVKS